jgi:hypothetical protein
MASRSTTISAIPSIDPALKKKQERQSKIAWQQRLDYMKSLRDAIFPKAKAAYAWNADYVKKFTTYATGNKIIDVFYNKVATTMGLANAWDSPLSIQHDAGNIYACRDAHVPSWLTLDDIKIGSTTLKNKDETIRICSNPRGTKRVIQASKSGYFVIDPDTTTYSIKNETGRVKLPESLERDDVKAFDCFIKKGVKECDLGLMSCFLFPTTKTCSAARIDRVETFATTLNDALDNFPKFVKEEREAREKALSKTIESADNYRKKASEIKTSITLEAP